MDKAIIGVFLNRTDAEDAIVKLSNEGYDPRDISIVMRDRGKGWQMQSSDIISGTVSGAVAGGVVGILAGLFIATGVIPGLGTILIGGPIAAALGLTGPAATTVSGAVTGALAGGLIGLLASLGMSKDEAKMYEDRIREGGILIAVPIMADMEDDVREILENYGADQVRSIRTSEELIGTRMEGIRQDARPAYYSRISRKRSKK